MASSSTPTLYARMELSLTEAEKRLAKFNRDLDKTMGANERRTQQAAARINKALASSTAIDFGKGIATSALAAGVGLLSLGAVIGQVKEALNQFGDIADKSAQAGLDPETFQEYAYAASLAGVEVGEVSAALATFAKNAGLAEVGKGKMIAALQKLNPELLANILATQDQAERLKLAVNAMDATATASDRAALSAVLFGDAGNKLAVALKGGSAAMAETSAKARELGIIIDNEVIARADELGDQFDTATAAIDVQFKSALINLAPLLVSTASLAADVAKAIALVVDSISALENRSTSMLETNQGTNALERLDVENKILELQRQQQDGTITKMDQAELANAQARLDVLKGEDVVLTNLLAKRREAATAAKTAGVTTTEKKAEVSSIDAAEYEKSYRAELALSNEQRALAAATERVLSDAKKEGVTLTQAQVEALARETIARDTSASAKDRSASASTKVKDAAEKESKAVEDLIAKLEYERSLIGLSEVEQAKMNALREAGASATDAQKSTITGLIEATDREKSANERLKESMDAIRDTSKDVLGGLIRDLRDGASAAEILDNIFIKISDRLIDMATSKLVDAALGNLGGSIFGSLLGSATATGGAAIGGKAIAPVGGNLPAPASQPVGGQQLGRMTAPERAPLRLAAVQPVMARSLDVIRPAAARAAGAAGGGVTFNPINNSGVPLKGRQEERSDGQGGRIYNYVMEEAVAGTFREGSAASRTMKQNFGVRRNMVKL